MVQHHEQGDAVSRVVLVDTDELRVVWRSAHDRLSSGAVVSSVRVGPLTDAERHAVADLLGLARLPPRVVTIPLKKLDAALSAAVGADTVAVVSELVGPVGDRRAARQQAGADRAALWRWLAHHPVVRAQPALDVWVAATRKAGVAGGDIDRARSELTAVLAVLDALPAPGLPLPALAATALGDPHGLDDGTRCGAAVLRALAAIFDVPHPDDAASRRDLWERAGATSDELSSTVLAAGLRDRGDSAAAGVLNVCADAGQAAALTLAQLRTSRLMVSSPGPVWVFENPSMLALALRRLARRCPPIVCISGWPSGAGILLLQQLADAGLELRYHGDFDGDGIRIAAHVAAATGAVPWAMTSPVYENAVRSAVARLPVGRVTDAPWDDRLGAVMRHHAIAVSEEQLADDVIEAVIRTAH